MDGGGGGGADTQIHAEGLTCVNVSVTNRAQTKPSSDYGRGGTTAQNHLSFKAWQPIYVRAGERLNNTIRTTDYICLQCKDP